MSVAPSQRTGLLRPFSRDQKAGFATASGPELVEGRVGAIVSSAGEVPWKPGLDAGLNKLRNVRANGSLQGFAQVYVSHALTQYEPALTGVTVSASRSGTQVNLHVEADLDGAPVVASPTLA